VLSRNRCDECSNDAQCEAGKTCSVADGKCR
jgi:hypothetical protein